MAPDVLQASTCIPYTHQTHMIQQIDHIGIAVKSLDATVPYYRDALGLGEPHIEEVPTQKVRVAMFDVAGVHIELLEPTSPESAIAKAIHKMSNRANGPFIEVNCAVLHENLIESELFGYEKGAFTGASSSGKIGKIELANHGTLFLDEIGELPAHIQSKLLQLIQEKTIERLSGTQKIELDFRLIVATNRNLEEAVQRGLFRSDLFYRLNVIRIHIPPLRQRKEDIVPMAHQFLARFCGEYNKSLTCSPRFLAFLEQYDWPGNVRQLENLMERLVITAQDPILDIPALPLEYTADASAPAELLPGGTLAERMDAYEAQIIRDSYQRCGTTVAVARELGISQATAARKIAKYVTARA